MTKLYYIQRNKIYNKFIIVRNVNMGGLVVVMNVDTYRSEALRQLLATNTYVRLRGDPTKRFKAILDNLIKKRVNPGDVNIRGADVFLSILFFLHFTICPKHTIPCVVDLLFLALGHSMKGWANGKMNNCSP